MSAFIDPPSNFDSVEKWNEFLREMLRAPDSEAVRNAIREARAVIEEKKQLDREPGD